MKKLFLLLIIVFSCISCTDYEEIQPDELGAKLFEIFKTNEVEKLRPIMLKIIESLSNEDVSSGNLSELSPEMRKTIEDLKTDEEYRKKADDLKFNKLKLYFNDARETLLAVIKTDILDYEIKSTYIETYLIQGKNMGRAIVEIQNDNKDKHFIGFEMIEIKHNRWVLHDGVYLVESVGKDYKRYE
jgi:hypothetical protein